MPNVLAMSFEGDLAPSFDLRCLSPQRQPPDGWGIGYYPGGDLAAEVLKEAAPPPGSIRSELVKAWEHLASSLFVLHIRTAMWGQISPGNTQPFRRSWGGRDWLMAHSGSLTHRIEANTPQRFEPIGSTDSELIFCQLMSMISDKGWRSLGDVDLEALRSFFSETNEHGSLTTILTDGHDMCVYADRDPAHEVYIWTLQPPHDSLVFGDGDILVDLTKRGLKSRKGVLICTNPLQPEQNAQVDWKRLAPGTLLRIRQGTVTAEVKPPEPQAPVQVPAQLQPIPQQVPDTQTAAPALAAPGGSPSQPFFTARARDLRLPSKAEVQRFSVVHRTVYRYQNPIERSTHLFRAAADARRAAGGDWPSAPPVGGREAPGLRGRVRQPGHADAPRDAVHGAGHRGALHGGALDTDPLEFRPPKERSTIPLVWMPWQRQVLQPFLLPQELPETQLVRAHRIRDELRRSATITTCSTRCWTSTRRSSASTSTGRARRRSTRHAFDVYASRRGVCQDFTNLFICLARLLGVPARYACGYIYCGPQEPEPAAGGGLPRVGAALSARGGLAGL